LDILLTRTNDHIRSHMGIFFFEVVRYVTNIVEEFQNRNETENYRKPNPDPELESRIKACPQSHVSTSSGHKASKDLSLFITMLFFKSIALAAAAVAVQAAQVTFWTNHDSCSGGSWVARVGCNTCVDPPGGQYPIVEIVSLIFCSLLDAVVFYVFRLVVCYLHRHR